MGKSHIARKFFVAAALVQALALPLNQANAQSGGDAVPEAKGQTSLVLAGASHHFGQRGYWEDGKYRPFNEINAGAGLEYRLGERFHLTAGAYKNSIHNLSVYAGAGVETDGSKMLGAGIEAGLVTGYQMAVAPMAVPYVRIGRRDGLFNLKLNVIPPLKDVTPAVLGVQLRLKFR